MVYSVGGGSKEKNISVRVLDVSPGSSQEEFVQIVTDEIHTQDCSEEVFWSNNSRSRIELQPQTVPEPSQNIQKTPLTLLCTGGARGISAEIAHAFQQAMDAMEPKMQEVVRWRLFDGLSFKEIAEMQGVPLNTALGRMHRALKQIRKSLTDKTVMDGGTKR